MSQKTTTKNLNPHNLTHNLTHNLNLTQLWLAV